MRSTAFTFIKPCQSEPLWNGSGSFERVCCDKRSQRIQYLNEGATKIKATHAKRHNLDERTIHKGDHIVQETLNYLSQQLNADIGPSGQTITLAPTTKKYILFYKQGLTTILTILETSEQCRFVLFAKDSYGWNVVLSLLSRFDAPVRALCCQVIGQCFMTGGRRPNTLDDLSREEWNRERLEQLALPACWSVIVHLRYSKWGVSATEETDSLAYVR
jgi:hypothetical protein